jgi:phosphoglycerol transferase MdoB-like AlkP superfamily enzyme
VLQRTGNQPAEAGLGGELAVELPSADPASLDFPRPLAGPVRFLVAFVIYAVALWWFDRHALHVASEAYFSLHTVAANAAVALPAVLVVWALGRRMGAAFLLIAFLQLATYLASAKKLEILGSPVALQDFHFVTNVSWANLELLGAYLDRPILVLLGTVSCLAAVVGAFILERPGFGRYSLVRFGLGAAGIALVLTLHSAAWPWRSVYTRDAIRPSALSRTPEALRSGLMSSLAYRHLEASQLIFKEDPEALRRAIEMVKRPGNGPVTSGGPVATVSATAPDIVVILSESFMDPRILKGMQDVPDVIPDVRALIEQGRGNSMVVPTYGGGTVRTEFEVLTGMPVAAFPGVMYPYADITRKKMPGLVDVLKRQGYSTVAVHGNSGGFWNRTNTYRSMGLDHFVTASGFPGERGRDGGWYSDKAMTDIVLEELDKSSSPTFVFAVSIENHGPYNKALPVRNQAGWSGLELPAGLDGDAALSWRNYLYHLGNADAQFARLVEAMRRRGRPFVVAMFGDHLPSLGGAYETLGFVNGEGPRKQHVPWVIVSSQAGPLAAAQRPIRSWQLPAEILAAGGVPGDAYFDFVREAGHRLDLAKAGGEREALESGVRAAAVARLEGRFEGYVGQ